MEVKLQLHVKGRLRRLRRHAGRFLFFFNKGMCNFAKGGNKFPLPDCNAKLMPHGG